MNFARRLLLCLFLLPMFTGLWATATRAHDLKMASVKIHLKQRAVGVSVTAHLHALNSKQSDAAIIAELSRRLRLRLDGQRFHPRHSQLLQDKANGIVIWQGESPRLTANVPTITIEAPLFPERQNEKTIVTIFKERRVWHEAVLDSAHPAFSTGDKQDKWSNKTPQQTDTFAVARQFLREGVTHIFGGPDHVLFLFSLLLLGGTVWQLLKIVTAFTIAHSITLSLAATNLVALPPRLVEPAIALSIVIAAGINMTTPELKNLDSEERRADKRPWLAFGFGLIHGFGFAGALREIGLPRESLGWALGAFNLGVELGQAILVLLFVPVLMAMVKMWPRIQKPFVVYGSALVGMAGLFWFAERVFS